MAHIQKERYAAAHGQFVAAANQGDADAARIALFMVRDGGMAFGSHWSASPDEHLDTASLARSNAGRPTPKFEEMLAARPASGIKRVQGVRCQLRDTVSWPSDC